MGRKPTAENCALRFLVSRNASETWVSIMLVLFASDLHGKTVFYDQMLDLIRAEAPSLVLLGGDLLPKSGRGEELYQAQTRFIKQDLYGFLKGVRRGHPSIDIGMMLGNDDLLSVREALSPLADEGLFYLMNRGEWVTASGWHVVGFDLIPETPFRLKDLERRDSQEDSIRYPSVDAIRSKERGCKRVDTQEWFLSQATLSEELAHLAPTGDPERTIFVSHTPPWDTPLDITVDGEHVGSKAVRSYIEKNQPLISFHGHIHESFTMSGTYATQIGNTVCFNPGQIHFPTLDAVLVDTMNPMRSRRHTAESSCLSREGFDLLKAPFLGE